MALIMRGELDYLVIGMAPETGDISTYSVPDLLIKIRLVCANVSGSVWDGHTIRFFTRFTFQAWNHQFFWESMKSNGEGEPSGELLELINRDFGSYDTFIKGFKIVAAT